MMGGLCSGLGWESWGAWGGMGIVGLILNLVFFVGLLAVLGLATTGLVRQLSRRPVSAKAETDPLEIARRRLAAGDIPVGDFEEIRSRLH